MHRSPNLAVYVSELAKRGPSCPGEVSLGSVSDHPLSCQTEYWIVTIYLFIYFLPISA